MPRKPTDFAAEALRLLTLHNGDYHAVAIALAKPGKHPPTKAAIVYALKARRDKIRYEHERRALPKPTNRHPSNPAVPMSAEMWKPEQARPLAMIPDYQTNTMRSA